MPDIAEQNNGSFKLNIFTWSSFVFAIIFSTFPLCYIFIARDIKYRCLIRECEFSSNTTYNPEWLKGFVPYEGNSLRRCLRYAIGNDTCSVHDVLKNLTVKCDTFVYQRDEITIVQDFDITCEENLWRLTMIGTLSGWGNMMCMMYAGFFSDRYGRKTLMILCISLSAIIGIIKSFSPNYTTYVCLEVLGTIFSGDVYGSTFILVMELVENEQRNMVNILMSSIYAVGQIILGLIAWLFPSWRMMLRLLYIPGLLSLSFFWSVPESPRWLLAKRKVEEARNVLQMTGHEGRQIPKDITDSLMKEETEEVKGLIKTQRFWDAISNRVLFLRLILCSHTWFSCFFLYQGLTIYSVSLSDNVYLSFIFSAAIEIPANILYYFASLKIRRRLIISLAFVSSGVACLAIGCVREDSYWTKVMIFLIGKSGSTIAFTLIIILTSEMFPTTSRHAMLSICVIFGRIGSMLAPQIPFMVRISRILPLVLFGICAITSGVITLFFPETLNTKLPETIEEAVHIGERSSQNRREED